MKFTLFWKTGQREVVEGDTPSQAMTLAGYSNGSLIALDFWAHGDNQEYVWNKETRSWIKPNGIANQHDTGAPSLRVDEVLRRAGPGHCG